MKHLKTFLALSLSFLFTSCLISQNSVIAEIDDILSETYVPNEPGATALVYQNGEVIFKKGYGLASLELNVPMVSDNVFEIGSITKQFTAIGILMLSEQGKLNLDDEITKYIPDYPTQGKSITIHHLLNHTSGIKSYTSMPSFFEKARVDMTPTELIDVFKNQPMDFDPGEKFLYNNSGYILLGHIIEVITEDTYQNFIQGQIFDKLGMNNSYYGSHKKIIKNRALGYQQNAKGFVNADYLSLTLPYAAGSLMSNVDDLLKWQLALNNHTLIKKETYEKAINGSTLNNGEKIAYGYGLNAGKLQGSKSISHGGGIFGYTTMGIYLPEEDTFVSLLTNCNCNPPEQIAYKIAALVIGKPFPNKEDAIELNEQELKKWVGAYKFPNGAIRHITVENGKIYSQRETSEKFQIFPLEPDYFIFEEGNISYKFSMVDGKKQAEFTTDETVIGKEIDKEAPKEKVAIELPASVLEQCVGTYELQPGFTIEITVSDAKMFALATGQDKVEVFAESEDSFFLKVVPATIKFNKSDQGDVISLTLFQGGQEMEGKKL